MPSHSDARCTCPTPVPPFDAMLDEACPVHGTNVAALLIDAIDSRLITEQPPGRCDLCGKVEETRPYGPNGENVCFGCGPGSKDPERVKAAERACENCWGVDDDA
jgi:hypothetical protein